ncbi:MAG TPA: tRNA (adenosine(37)-N6)-threonylcarbamoyltransferase complex dimerization subunit type 1 TsaB [Patescibacteria group bacterium]|nr:tRNA (adenosine(37)-N6)-threonylcarbamoyltransferase complex dimerization subunit type 1 TsaB [Patescibacteria group bacterium]
MIILTIKTDNPVAEVGLFNNSKKLDYISWEAHKQLSATIHLKIKEILDNNNLSLNDLNSIIIYKGPGSFTGLRIGFSVANAFSYSLNIPLIAESGKNWASSGTTRAIKGNNDFIAAPVYGAKPHITIQKK